MTNLDTFELGQINLTKEVFKWRDDSKEFARFVRDSLGRHSKGDWGDLFEQDKQANDAALVKGGRLLSAYKMDEHTKIWIITEADRSSTSVLFSNEY